MWYGFHNKGISLVTDNYSEIDLLQTLLPYSSYRKFYTHEEAYSFVSNKEVEDFEITMNTYGDVFDNLHVTVTYFITDEGLYFNIDTSKLGDVRFTSTSSDVVIENSFDNTRVYISSLKLDDDRISSHAIAIYKILQVIGDLLDVNIVVPNHSIYYMLTAYTGTKITISRLLRLIEQRSGNVAVTLNKWWKDDR